MAVIHSFEVTGSGDWTIWYTDNWPDDGTPPYGFSEITDAIDYRLNDTNVGALAAIGGEPVIYTSGDIVRFKGSLSLSALPDTTTGSKAAVALFGLSMSSGYYTNPISWSWYLWCGVRSDGKLVLRSYNSKPVVVSENAISAGVTYDVEMVWDRSGATPSHKLYIDGELWAEDDGSCSNNDFRNYARVLFWEGLLESGPFDPYPAYWTDPSDVTLHIGAYTRGSHIWTIEGPGGQQPIWVVY